MRKLNLTASMLRAYKACPRLYELQYIHLLKPERTSEALETGTNYHAQLEKLFRGEALADNTLPGIMAQALDRFVPWREWGVTETEREFEIRLTPFLSLRGKIDALTADGMPVEHKSAGQSIADDTAAGLKYADRLAWDDQVSIYLLATGKTRLKYTVCQKPSIRRKKDETEEEYLSRCREWYDSSKVRTFDVTRTPEELAATEAEIRMLASEIRRRKRFYRNPAHCAFMGCQYAPVCLLDDVTEAVGFVKKERVNEELCKF